MIEMKFFDSKEFYESLKNNLESGVDVEIKTSFKSKDEVPETLSGTLGGSLFYSSVATIMTPGVIGFSPGTSSSYKLNWTVIAAGVGAAVGFFCAGPVGVAVGAGVGAVVGFIADMAASSGEREVNLQVDSSGKLNIKIKFKK